MCIMHVSAWTRSKLLAGAIAKTIRTSGRVELRAIGAGAVNQAIKAAARARYYLAEDEIDIVVIPGFVELSMGEAECTAIQLTIKKR